MTLQMTIGPQGLVLEYFLRRASQGGGLARIWPLEIPRGAEAPSPPTPVNYGGFAHSLSWDTLYLGETTGLLQAFPHNNHPLSRELFPLYPVSREHYGDTYSISFIFFSFLRASEICIRSLPLHSGPTTDIGYIYGKQFSYKSYHINPFSLISLEASGKYPNLGRLVKNTPFSSFSREFFSETKGQKIPLPEKMEIRIRPLVCDSSAPPPPPRLVRLFFCRYLLGMLYHCTIWHPQVHTIVHEVLGSHDIHAAKRKVRDSRHRVERQASTETPPIDSYPVRIQTRVLLSKRHNFLDKMARNAHFKMSQIRNFVSSLV